MKLYFMPGACSLAPHIALREAGLRFSLIEVDYATRRTATGRDFRQINPKAYVPVLELNDGAHLTEVSVILQFIDMTTARNRLLPVAGMDRLRALEWLSYISTEIHKSFSPLYRPTTPEAFLPAGRAHLTRRLDVIEAHLRHRKYLMGGLFSLADVYLFTVCRWLADQELSIAHWPSVQRHSQDIAARPAVREALEAEGMAATHASAPSSAIGAAAQGGGR